MIWERLEREMGNLPRAQKNVVKYMLENPSEALFMTSQQLGANSQTSEATVIRLAVALGFSGFPEFKEALQRTAKDQLSTFGRLQEHRLRTEGRNLLSGVISEELAMAANCLRDSDDTAIRELARHICSAAAIYLVGLRSARSLAVYMQFYLSWFFPNVYVPESDYLESYLVSAPQNALLVGISFPRYTKLTVDALRAARGMGLHTAAITDSETSPLASEADVVIKAPCNHVAHIDSLMIPLGMVNAILIEVTDQLGGKALTRLEELEAVWADGSIYC